MCAHRWQHSRSVGGKLRSPDQCGDEGAVEDSKIYSMEPVVTCLHNKLRGLQQTKANTFPPPPQAPYWVRLDLNWADFAPVAAK